MLRSILTASATVRDRCFLLSPRPTVLRGSWMTGRSSCGGKISLSPTNCPKDLAKTVIEAGVYLSFRPCSGVAHVPLLLDGQLITTPGYHSPTGLILDLRGKPLTIPHVLDKEAAETAMERLLKPFRGYLEHGAVDRTALLGAALTAALRPSLPTAPAILIDGNTPAVGKGKLARALAALATSECPRSLPRAIATKRPRSASRRRLAGLACDPARQPAAAHRQLDPGEHPHGAGGRHPHLRQAPDPQGGVPGALLLTANNATMRVDMLRRTLSVRIVVADDKPEPAVRLRPGNEAVRDRAELLAAAFTVVLAWLRARHLPENAARRALGSFEEWADIVAGAVSWLTGKSPVALIEARKDQDDRTTSERGVIAALAERFGDAEWKAKAAAQEIAADIWAAAMRFKGEQPTANEVSYWLRKRKDRVYAFEAADGTPARKALSNTIDRNGVASWFLRGMRGIAGDNPPPANSWLLVLDPNWGRHGEGEYPPQSPVSPAPTCRRRGGPGSGRGRPAWPRRGQRMGEVTFRLVTTAEEARKAVGELAVRGLPVGLDLETTGLDPLTAEARLLQLAAPGEPVVVVDLFRAGGLEALREPLEQLRAVAHNAVFELGFLHRAGVRLMLGCTMLASHALDRQAGEPGRAGPAAPWAHARQELADARTGRGELSPGPAGLRGGRCRGGAPPARRSCRPSSSGRGGPGLRADARRPAGDRRDAAGRDAVRCRGAARAPGQAGGGAGRLEPLLLEALAGRNPRSGEQVVEPG